MATPKTGEAGQPLELPTTFTHRNITTADASIYGITPTGQIWRRKRTGNAWVNTGVAIPDVPDSEI